MAATNPFILATVIVGLAVLAYQTSFALPAAEQGTSTQAPELFNFTFSKSKKKSNQTNFYSATAPVCRN